MLESMPAREWNGEGRGRFIALDGEISKLLKAQQIKHYYPPFPDRQDYSFLYYEGSPQIGDVPPRTGTQPDPRAPTMDLDDAVPGAHD